jgi:hypothetical protein
VKENCLLITAFFCCCCCCCVALLVMQTVCGAKMSPVPATPAVECVVIPRALCCRPHGWKVSPGQGFSCARCLQPCNSQGLMVTFRHTVHTPSTLNPSKGGWCWLFLQAEHWLRARSPGCPRYLQPVPLGLLFTSRTKCACCLKAGAPSSYGRKHMHACACTATFTSHGCFAVCCPCRRLMVLTLMAKSQLPSPELPAVQR